MPESADLTLAYSEAFDCLNQALSAPRGIRLTFHHKGKASNFRHQLYSARRADRKLSFTMHPPEHPMHGRSHYDQLKISMESSPVEGKYYIIITPSLLQAADVQIEEL